MKLPLLRIQPYRADNGEYRWRLLARNNRIVGDSGEGYKRRADRDRMMRLIADGPIEVVDEP